MPLRGIAALPPPYRLYVMNIQDIKNINPEALLTRFVDAAQTAPTHRHENLDWPAVLDAIAQRCRSNMAKTLVKNMPAIADRDLLARRHAEIAEMMALYEACDPVVAIVLDDIDPWLKRAQRGSVLGGEDLLKIAANLATFHAVRRYFEVRREEAPLLYDYAVDIVPLKALERKLATSLDPDGKLVDDASPQLAQLREKSRRLAESLRTRIEAKLASPEIQENLQDSYYTLREGRYVLPVRAPSRSKIPGIVHATSASGQTVFIEPDELVELNNALRIVDFGIEAEEQRILLELSKDVGEHREDFQANTRRCLYLETADAIAHFGTDCHGHLPDLSASSIELYQARHPLLALRHFDNPENIVVPNDIILNLDAGTFVISGANAGGKTVNLKTVGLCALMVNAGIPVCAGASSCFPVFQNVFADIGDDQSIAQNISTFSAHVQSLARALPKVGPHTLFLLDEPFSGTDPEHASPLVIALTEYLHEKGAVTFLTTHFENVKAFALETPWIASASVSFDMERMKPTYHLQSGHPGTSAAFEIAQQHGLAPEILQNARLRYDSKATSNLEHAISELEKQRVRLEEARQVVLQTQENLDKSRAEVEELREKLRTQTAKSLGQDIQQLQDTIHKIKARISKLRRKTFTADFRRQTEIQDDIDREMNALEAQTRKELSKISDLNAPPFSPLPEREITIGKTVHIRQYHKNARVLARSGAHVTLQLGILQVHANLADLGAPILEPTPEPTARQKRINAIKSSKNIVIQPQDTTLIDETTQRPIMAQIRENTLDLRGLTSEDAIERTDFFLQSMIIKEQKMCYIIHGHGTGVLKHTIRQFLSKSPSVEATRPGQYYEGGDGVTLAWLKS